MNSFGEIYLLFATFRSESGVNSRKEKEWEEKKEKKKIPHMCESTFGADAQKG